MKSEFKHLKRFHQGPSLLFSFLDRQGNISLYIFLGLFIKSMGVVSSSCRHHKALLHRLPERACLDRCLADDIFAGFFADVSTFNASKTLDLGHPQTQSIYTYRQSL